jgi:hypothetical protein
MTFLTVNTLFIFDTSAKGLSSDISRADPPYDYIIGKDKLPHFRACFWVPLTASKFKPYADKNVKTDVSHHGPVENWGVVESNIKDADKKLVYIFVPKTFVILNGRDFYKSIHLSYE